MARFSLLPVKASAQFWLLTTFLLAIFLTGGSSRMGAQSLVIVRPLSIIACGIALAMLRLEHLRGRAWLLGGFGAIMLLSVLHLVPLPADLWQSLPGRQALAQIDRLTGADDMSRALTLAPLAGWHALSSLFVPLAVLLFGIQLSREELYRLLPLLIGLGALSGLFGLLQVIGGANGPLYLYESTNYGSAVGLFANRNHAAILLACMFPMLAVFASTGNADGQNSRQLMAAAIAIVLVPLILVTGSRSGLLFSLVGLLGGALLYRRPANKIAPRRKKKESKVISPPVLAGLAIVACLAFITIFYSRAKAIDRLFDDGLGDNLRAEFWQASIELFWNYFPWGSGSGAFVDVFRMTEVDATLGSTYANRAHNDWIEMALALGLPGLLLSAVILGVFLRRAWSLSGNADGKRRSVAFGRMAGIAIAIVAGASGFDYPLRTPIFMCVFSLFALWFSMGGNSADAHDERARQKIETEGMA